MRDPERIDLIIELLRETWKNTTDLRFCQLISSITYPLTYKGKSLFYVEDDEFKKAIEEFKTSHNP